MRARPVIALSICLAASVVVAGAGVAADTYTIDPSHSSIGFTVRHMVVTKVKGQFNEFAGTIVYDDKDVTKSSVEVTIKTASIDTNTPRRDDDLRSPNFFDAAKYPEITFKSRRIEKSEDGHVAIGDLTMHGVTREIEIPFTIAGFVTDPMGNARIGLSAGTSLNRQDYGITWSKKLDSGGLVAGDEVEVDIEVEAIKAK
jgi:polyisoprenoid-binding protein YceI